MVDLIKQRHSREADSANGRDAAALRSYRDRHRSRAGNADGLDEIIVTLANAYENKRERQIMEWDQHRRQSDLRSLTLM